MIRWLEQKPGHSPLSSALDKKLLALPSCSFHTPRNLCAWTWRFLCLEAIKVLQKLWKFVGMYNVPFLIANVKHLCTPDALRRKVWPKLLGLDTQAATEPPTEKELEAHAEYHQVVLDVDRSLKRFPPGKYIMI